MPIKLTNEPKILGYGASHWNTFQWTYTLNFHVLKKTDLNPRTLDTEASTLPWDHRSRLISFLFFTQCTLCYELISYKMMGYSYNLPHKEKHGRKSKWKSYWPTKWIIEIWQEHRDMQTKQISCKKDILRIYRHYLSSQSPLPSGKSKSSSCSYINTCSTK